MIQAAHATTTYAVPIVTDAGIAGSSSDVCSRRRRRRIRRRHTPRVEGRRLAWNLRWNVQSLLLLLLIAAQCIS